MKKEKEINSTENTKKIKQKEKKVKEQKKVSTKKLPKILKKKYSQKKLNKLLKHIYISTDRELVEKMFVPYEQKQGFFYIPQNQLIEKKEFNKLKKIGKDVASQKFSIKLVPLGAVIAFCVLIVMLIVTFKNFAVKWLLTKAMQEVFGAKTDIAYVDVQILDSKITVNNLAQGYRSDPWKNLFEISVLRIDFNLTELLRGKIDIQDVAVEGINVMTPRKTSAALAKHSSTGMDYSIPEFFEYTANNAQAAAKQEIDKMFDKLNPETILKNLESQLTVPTVANEVYEIGDSLVKKWQTKPDEIAKNVKQFSDKTNDIINANWSNISDPNVIRQNIEKIDNVIKDGKNIVDETKIIVEDVKKDSQIITESANKMKNALEADQRFVNNEVNKIKSFKLDDGLRLLSEPIQSFICNTTGRYYPYIRQVVNLALKAKSSSSGNAKETVKETKKSETHDRLDGIDVYYKYDNVPKFLLERFSCSSVNWSGLATNISSDMDKRGMPAFAQAKVEALGQLHNADVTVDARTVTDKPLVAANYSGTNYPLAFSVPQFAVASKSTISGRGTVSKTGAVVIGAGVNLRDLDFKTTKFEPEYAYKLYSKALSYLKELYLEIEFEMNSDTMFKMNIKTDADKQLINILNRLVMDELQELMQMAQQKITELLREQTKNANIKIDEFIDIENGINAQSIKLDKISAALDQKKKELQDKLISESRNKINEAIGTKNSETVNDVLNGLNNLNRLKGFGN